MNDKKTQCNALVLGTVKVYGGAGLSVSSIIKFVK